MKIEINDNFHAIIDGMDQGFAADVVVNHLADIDPAAPAQSVSHQVARAAMNAAAERVTAAETRASEAEQRAQDLERFRPATDTEIEREAQAEAERRRFQQQVSRRADEILSK